MACYCCVSGCKNNNHKPTVKHFFRFPKNDKKRQKLWKRFTRKGRVPSTAVICEEHFEPKYMIQKDKKLKLSNDAVPTIFFEKTLEFDGSDYFGDEAEEMNKANDAGKDKEIVEIETAFVNEQLKLDDLKSRCRFCAESKEEVIDISSFQTYNVNIDIFLKSLNLHFIESDFFPSSVCEECFKQVVLIDTFIIKCKAAEQWLWDEVAKLKTISAAIARPEKSEQEMKTQENISYEELIKIEKTDRDNYQEKVCESCDQEVQEIHTENDDETAKLYTISYVDTESLPPEKAVKASSKSDFFEEFAASKADEKSKSEEKKIPPFAIMDPACNKFAMKSYNCEVCLKVFAGLKTYKSHICDVPEIRCSVCSQICETVFELQKHRRLLHTDIQKNYCPVCKTIITGSSTVFKRHKTKCNRKRTENIKCELCPKVSRESQSDVNFIIFLNFQTYTTLQGYTVHQIFHECHLKKQSDEDVLGANKEKPVKRKGDVICEVCGKTYTTIG